MDARLTVSTMRSACQFVQLSACLRHVSGRKRYPQKVRKPLCPLHFRSMVIPTGSRAPACAVTTDVRTHGTCASMRQGIMQHILRRQQGTETDNRGRAAIGRLHAHGREVARVQVAGGVPGCAQPSSSLAGLYGSYTSTSSASSAPCCSTCTSLPVFLTS